MSSLDNLHYEKIGRETRCIEDEIPFEIPSSWTWARLREVVLSNIGGGTPSKSNPNYWNGNISWASVKDLAMDSLNLKNTFDKISELGLRNSTSNLIPSGTIIICARMGLGKIVISDIDVAINQDLRALIFSNFIFKKYFVYFYKTLKFNGQGLTVKGITLDEIYNILIPLPPLQEQKRIVDKLEEILPLVEKYKEDKEKLDELNLNFPLKLKKSILDYAIKGKLVEQNLEDESVEILLQKIREEKQRLIKDKKLKADKFPQSTIFIGEDNSPYEKIGRETRCIADEIPFEIPKNWAWVRLGEVGLIYTGDSINQAQKLAKYTNLKDGRHYIATKDVGFDGVINYENSVKIPFNESKFKVAPKDSVLLCVEGGSAGKKIGYLNYDVCFGNKLCCFNPLLVNSKFIFYYLQSQIFLDSFTQKISGIISGVSLNAVKTIIIALPPLSEQKQIVKKIESLLPLLKS
ncbi:restriction endonuclease subunit S [Campylobacter sp. RM16187]|uniref:restriction endonuclease subunit S n=1 Tax=Campylobacter sp. RM16187 TaxID=1660063 RepID=UPI0021B64FBA|nr:restriction endonuclease subunit S [Campylobacter sp. RM16187]